MNPKSRLYYWLEMIFNDPRFLSIAFFLLLIFISIGKVARWDLADQISMADNYLRHGFLYPSLEAPDPFGVSLYFPGVAILAIFFEKLGIEFYIVEFMLIIAVASTILFLFLQAKLASELSVGRIKWVEFLPICIAFSLLVAPFWLSYAVEFKPDTIALSMGLLGMYASSFLVSNVRVYRILIGAFLCAIALIFKQQYVAFLMGISIFCLARPSRERIIFLLLLTTFSSLIVFNLYQSSNLWFWNVLIFANHGAVPWKEAVRDNLPTLKAFLFMMFCGASYVKLSKFSSENSCRAIFSESEKAKIFSFPWIWVAIPSSVAAFASALKNGGNHSNTELGLILLMPIIILAFQKIHKSVIIKVAWIAFFFSLPMAYSGTSVYLDAVHLRSFLLSDVAQEPSIVLTDSTVYFASRVYRRESKMVNYWSVNARDTKDVAAGLSKAVSISRPDRIVAENCPSNKDFLNSDVRYRIIFENKLGLVAALR